MQIYHTWADCNNCLNHFLSTYVEANFLFEDHMGNFSLSFYPRRLRRLHGPQRSHHKPKDACNTIPWPGTNTVHWSITHDNNYFSSLIISQRQTCPIKTSVKMFRRSFGKTHVRSMAPIHIISVGLVTLMTTQSLGWTCVSRCVRQVHLGPSNARKVVWRFYRDERMKQH